eukprot:m.44843 g.44843  ORF g.44843 m.44843 type:complete len:383 (+) comp19788_c0_seq2:152-1300(+)
MHKYSPPGNIKTKSTTVHLLKNKTSNSNNSNHQYQHHHYRHYHHHFYRYQHNPTTTTGCPNSVQHPLNLFSGCDIGVESAGCLSNDGTSGDTTASQAGENAYAFVNMMWGNSADFGCACANSKIACLMEVVPQSTEPPSTACANITASTCHEEVNLTYTYDNDCYLVGEDGDSVCTLRMLPGKDYKTTMNFANAYANCFQNTSELLWNTVTSQLTAAQTTRDDSTEPTHWSIYFLIAFSVLLVVVGVVLAIVFKTRLTHVYFRFRPNKQWIEEEKVAHQSLNARKHAKYQAQHSRRESNRSRSHIMAKPHFHPHAGLVHEESSTDVIKQTAAAHMSPTAKFLAKKRADMWKAKVESNRTAKAALVGLRERKPVTSDMGELEL